MLNLKDKPFPIYETTAINKLVSDQNHAINDCLFIGESGFYHFDHKRQIINSSGRLLILLCVSCAMNGCVMKKNIISAISPSPMQLPKYSLRRSRTLHCFEKQTLHQISYHGPFSNQA
jgi:hypothetical protein